jgi:hypothetical protein
MEKDTNRSTKLGRSSASKCVYAELEGAGTYTPEMQKFCGLETSEYMFTL